VDQQGNLQLDFIQPQFLLGRQAAQDRCKVKAHLCPAPCGRVQHLPRMRPQHTQAVDEVLLRHFEAGFHSI